VTINRFALTQALLALGNAEVMIGNPFKAGGMKSLGAKEGPIQENISFTLNELTAPENTGGIPHQATSVVGAFTVTAPIVGGDPDLWAKIVPHGAQVGVSDNPVDVVETSMFLIPRKEIDPVLGLSHVAETGTSAGVYTADSGNVGNATVGTITGKVLGATHKVKITFLSATTFAVFSQYYGALANGTVGVAYTSAAVNFTVTAGGTAMVAGDFGIIQLTAAGGGWSPAPPVNALFFPRCYVSHADVGRPYDNGGKSIIPVTFHPMYYAAGPPDRRVYVRGDPVAWGYGTLLI
jgi:hypothetical protein